jgi:hypothetical protein
MESGSKITISKAIFCSWINCNVELFNDAEHTAHLESHANDVIEEWNAPSRCLWEGCRSKATFKSSKAYRHHLTNIHTHPLVCDDTGCTYKKPFRNNGDLNRHKITAHSANKLFQCPYESCQADVRSFIRKDKLLQHIQEIQHENDAFCPRPHCTYIHRSRHTGFSDRKAISAHFSTYHSLLREGGYECSLGNCAETNYHSDWSIWGLKDHLQYQHKIPSYSAKEKWWVVSVLVQKMKRDKGKTILLAHLQALEQEIGCNIPWHDCQICEGKEIGTMNNGEMEH